MKNLKFVLTHVRLLKIIFWLIALLLGGFQAWAYRYNLSSEDIISYLDISDFYVRGEWQSALNSYWSPLYSILLLPMRLATGFSPAWEFPSVKLTNFLIYLFTLVCFEIFLRQFMLYYKRKNFSKKNALKVPDYLIVVLGYSLFLLSALKWTRLSSDTPDMCAAGLIYLAAALVLNLQIQSSRWYNFALFGIVLGLAYLVRSATLSVTIAFLVCCIPFSQKPQEILPKVLTALGAFLCVVSPFIIALSLQKGYFTFRESGKLNYVWSINPGSYSIIGDRYWQGGPPGYGNPIHPPRQILKNPDFFEFSQPIEGTYPSWTDPSYWYQGIKLRFDIGKQIKSFIKNLQFYWSAFLGFLIYLYLLLAVFSGNRFKYLLSDMLSTWRLLVPALLGLTSYALVADFKENNLLFQPNTRYLAFAILLLYFGVFSGIRLANFKSSKKLIIGLTLVSAIFVFGSLYSQIKWDFSKANLFSRNIHWEVAQEINSSGIEPGEKIAIIGHESNYIFWAKLARVKIIAQAPNIDEFWAADITQMATALEKLKESGAKAIIINSLSLPKNHLLKLGWKEIGKTGYFAYFLKQDMLGQQSGALSSAANYSS